MFHVNKNSENAEFVQLLSGIISLITAGIALFSFYAENGRGFNFWLILSLFLSIFVLILSVIKYWNRANKWYDSTASSVHEFNHRLRDELYTLKLLSIQNKLTRETLLANVQKTGEFAVNLLGELLSEITRTRVSVHIKTFPVDTSTPNSYRTLCICAKTDPNRKTIKDHSIFENTHYLRIVSGQDSCFFSENLSQTIKDYEKAGQKFLISAEHWEKRFKSILVVPIRIEARLKGIEDDKKYDYLGFVCCDSMEKSAFKLKDKEAHLNLVKSFADGLYVYLDDIKGYLNSL